MRIRKFAPIVGAAILALTLTGCAQSSDTMPDNMPGMDHGTNPTQSSVPDDVNGADEMFVMMMIPHHEQAIEMSDLVLAKDGVDPRVTDLAQQIKDAQTPEIEQMKSWLEDWGTPYDETGMGSMGGMDGGMMSTQDMDGLESAAGADASKLYLEQMIVHHQGAIDMAASVLDDGQNEGVAELAEAIVDGQTAEIATMQEILGTL